MTCTSYISMLNPPWILYSEGVSYKYNLGRGFVKNVILGSRVSKNLIVGEELNYSGKGFPEN